MKERDFAEWQAAFPGMFDNVYCGFALPLGWTEIVWKGCQALANIKTHQVQVAQVKEKFGGLRFYYAEERLPPDPAQYAEEAKEWGAGYTPEYVWWADAEMGEETIERIIDAMEKASYWTCETCGTTADVTTEGGWITTKCRPCRTKLRRAQRWATRWWKFKRALKFWRKW